MVSRRKTQLGFLAILVAVAVVAVPLSASGDVTSSISVWGDSSDFADPYDIHPLPDGGSLIVDRTAHVVRVFDDTNTQVDVWGTPNVSGSGDDHFNNPRGLDIDRSGYVWVADASNHRVKVLTPDGDFYAEITGLTAPYDVACDPRGRVYVANAGASGVEVYRSDIGQNVGTIGTPGAGVGQLSFPRSVAVDYFGRVYVSDSGNNRIQRWTRAGAFSGLWGGPGSGPGELDDPRGIGVNPRGDLYVGEHGNSRVQFVTDSFAHLGYVSSGYGDPMGVTPGKYRDVYVTDPDADQITEYFGAEPTSTATEISGVDRYATAVALSESDFKTDSCDTVILATGQGFADALAAAPLAGWGARSNPAPILLTRTNSLPADVAEEIKRLLPTTGSLRTVYIVGGTGAVSAEVEAQVKAVANVDIVVRLAGATRYDTASKIVSHLSNISAPPQMINVKPRPRPIFVCTGRNFPDALAVGPVATAMQSPIYLANGDAGITSAITKPWDGYMDVSEVILVGGTSVVPEVVKTQIDAALSGAQTYTRIAGATRYETAALLAEYMVENYGFDWGHTAFAVGTNYPDALAGGPIQGFVNSPLLLTAPGTLPAGTLNVIKDNEAGFYDIRYLGGSGAVSSAVRTQIEAELR